jgi:hypothetical protein
MKIIARIVLTLAAIIGIVVGLAGLSGCDFKPTATQIEAHKQEQLTLQGVQSVGLPSITNFAEKRLLKDLLELRDKSPATYTYLVDMNNNYKFLCNSVGFGFPYATQFTNPSHVDADTQHGYAILPQADPNGLYSPASAEGTWIFCVDPKTEKPTPMYIEPRVIVSTFPLK